MRHRIALAGLLLFFTAGTAGAERLPRNVVPELYKLTISPRMDLGLFLGDEVITVRVTEPTREITLHAADLEIDRVFVRDSVRKQRARVELDPARTTMTIHLRREIVPGTAEIGISYRGLLRKDLRGLYVSRSARDEYLFTQLQPTDARRFFPSFDDPGLKARFDLTVIVDRSHIAISNSRIISTLPGPRHNTRRIRFRTTPPMSTYMLALAVGPFDCLTGRYRDVPVRFCAQQGQEARGRMTFEGTVSLLEFYEDWFGVPYPFEKLDVVALPDMAAGGMENPGAVFLREGWAMIDRDAAVETKRWVATLLAHEVSHMWVGDLVTMEWWSDVWLNEGLATWIATKALRAWKPETGGGDVQTFRRIRALDEDSLGSRRAVAGPVDDDRRLFELFDLVSSEKPAAMMVMVEQIAGEDAVRRAIRDYLITYSWGNASTADFVSHIERELGDESAAVIRDYVSRPGFPVIEVSSECVDGAARVVFSEQRDGGEPWHIPVCYRPLASSAETKCVVVAGRAAVSIEGACGVPILVNPGEPGFYRVLYSRSDLSRIVDSTRALSVPEKLNLLDNEWWLVMEGRNTVGDFLLLLERGFADERDPPVVAMIVSRLGVVEKNFAIAELRGDLTTWMRSYFGGQLRRVGLHPAKGETAKDALLRRELLWGAGALGRDPKVIELSRRYVRELLDDPGAVDRALADTMIHLAAKSGDQALYNAYLSRVRRARNLQDGYRFLMGLSSFTSPELVRRTLDLTMTDVVRSQDATSVVGKLLANPASAETAWPYVRDHWPEIAKRLPVTFTSDRIVAGAGSFCTSERREEVASFFRTVAAPPNTLDAALARIDRCIAGRSAQAMALSSWLAESSRMVGSTGVAP